jgi:cell division protein FtsZ
VTGGEDVSLYEVQEAASVIEAAVAHNANIIWGLLIDPNFPRGQVKVTLIATGFDGERRSDSVAEQRPQLPQRAPTPVQRQPNQDVPAPLPTPPQRDARTPSQPLRNFPTQADVDIPVFVRRNKDR